MEIKMSLGTYVLILCIVVGLSTFTGVLFERTYKQVELQYQTNLAEHYKNINCYRTAATLDIINLSNLTSEATKHS